jgi:hypothetical protein
MRIQGVGVRVPRAILILVVACLSFTGRPIVATTTPEVTPASLLRDLHPDYAMYISEIHVVSTQEASVSPEGIYSGLVRPGGRDPRILDDTPIPGKGARNDVILYPSAMEPSRGKAWLRLILDHEYFHARHLAGSSRVPLVEFGEAAANHAYYEAVAWGYVLERGLAGVYGELSVIDFREVRATYRRHFHSFRRFIQERQPSSWVHYGRFLKDPE